TLISTGTQNTLVGNIAGSTLVGTSGTGTVAWYAANSTTLNLTTGLATLSGHSDTLIGVNTVYATGSGDTLIGGGAGTNTTLIGLSSNDSFIGGAGTTTVVTVGNNKTMNLNTGSLTNVMSAEISGYFDVLVGGSGAEFLETYASASSTGDPA